MSLDPLTDPDWALLARFFAGEASHAEVGHVETWLAGAPERRALAEQLRRVWTMSAELLPLEDVDAALVRIKTRENESVVIPLPVTTASEVPAAAQSTPAHALKLSRLTRLHSVMRWPAAIAALLVLGVGAALWRTHALPNTVATSPSSRMTDIATKRGERARLRLPDGSKVVLAPESRLRFAETFATARRDLYLEGEAYIEAVHDDAKPLRVYAGGAVTEDIGTAFVVRAYAGSPVQVAVAEGAVRLESRHAGRAEQVLLSPAERGTVRDDGSIVHERGIALEPETAWTDGRLVFTDTPLRDALPQLSRWYDLDIHLAEPSLRDLRLNATFDHEAASDVLRLVGLILDLEVEQHGSSVVFHRKGSHP